MKTTIVIITRDRPLQVKRLIDSIFQSKIPSLSLVLIDDSTRENFESTKNFIRLHKDLCEHKNSWEVQREVESVIGKIGLAATEKSLLETCVGLRSPFLEFAESIPKNFLFRKSFIALLSRSFGPYSTARNLGIYCAHKAFKPEKIVFLDDDCYIAKPESLKGALQLVEKKIGGKEIIAVSGLYEDLSLFMRKRIHPYEEFTPASILTGMDSFLKRSFLTEQKKRLTLTPYHTLGGALILSKRVFLSLPFDPFTPRGEDHTYCIDLKARYGRDFAIVRDNYFVVQHNQGIEESRNLGERNILRDIFRFVYLRYKVGRHFIPCFTGRWTLNALIRLFLEPSRSKQRLLELWALLFLARIYAKRNSRKYPEIIEVWNLLLKRNTESRLNHKP